MFYQLILPSTPGKTEVDADPPLPGAGHIAVPLPTFLHHLQLWGTLGTSVCSQTKPLPIRKQFSQNICLSGSHQPRFWNGQPLSYQYSCQQTVYRPVTVGSKGNVGWTDRWRSRAALARLLPQHLAAPRGQADLRGADCGLSSACWYWFFWKVQISKSLVFPTAEWLPGSIWEQ